MKPTIVRRGILGTAAVLTLCLLGPRQANAYHIEHCFGEFEGFLIEDWCESYCWVEGFWDNTFNTRNGYFVFHFHGWTEDSDCFGMQESGPGCPEWVEDELCEECGLCIEECYTYGFVDWWGNVFVRVEGYAYPCECYTCN